MQGATATPIDDVESREKLERQQKLRLRLVGRVYLTYAIDALMLALFAWAGMTHALVPIGSALVGLAICGCFAIAIWQGWNLRFREPSLALPQMLAGATAQVVFLGWAPEVGFFFLLGLLITLSIGALQLTTRQLFLWSGACAAGAGVAIYVAGERLVFPVSSPLHQALVWVGFVAVLARFTYFSAYVSHLRETLRQRNKQLASSNEQVTQLATIDELTRVYNRRYMTNLLAEEKSRLERTGLEFCVALLDLDHFKSVNDTFGHAKGDEVLQAFAETALASIRATDYLGRHGGEEFLVLFPATSREAVPAAAERIRAATAVRDWEAIAPGLALTVSIGIAACRRGETIDQVVDRADKALYEAKHAGRNRAVLA